MLHSICQQIKKTQLWQQDSKRAVFIPVPKNGNARVFTLPYNCTHCPWLARECSESFKLGFISTWTENFQTYKLDSEKERDQRSNCQHPLDNRESRGIPEKIYFCFIHYPKAFDCVDHNELWKILKKMGLPDCLTCLLRTLYARQEATVRIRHGTMECFKIEKQVCQGCILLPSLFNFYADYIIGNAGLDESQAGIMIARRNYEQLQICRWHHSKGIKLRGP